MDHGEAVRKLACILAALAAPAFGAGEGGGTTSAEFLKLPA